MFESLDSFEESLAKFHTQLKNEKPDSRRGEREREGGRERETEREFDREGEWEGEWERVREMKAVESGLPSLL